MVFVAFTAFIALAIGSDPDLLLLRLLLLFALVGLLGL